MLSIIGGPSEQITLEAIVSHGGTGTITAHMEIDFKEAERDGGLELVYTISPNPGDTFRLTQHHSKLGRLEGSGAVTRRTILLTFRSEDGAYTGFEAAEKIDDDHYHLRGALSLNGMPSTVLEAAIRRLGREEQ
jgi:hypothetical protein